MLQLRSWFLAPLHSSRRWGCIYGTSTRRALYIRRRLDSSEDIRCASTSNGQAAEEVLSTGDAVTVKRKIALHVAYVGTNYRGLQKSEPRGGVLAVEDVLIE